MGNQKECRFCQYSDPKRKKNEKIRCKKLHEYADPFGVCAYYVDASLDNLRDELRKLFFH